MSQPTNTFPESLVAQTATIAISTTTSDIVDLQGATLLGFQIPAAFTGTAITFNVGLVTGTLIPLYDRLGTLVSVPVAASRAFSVDPALFVGWQFVQLVSNGSEAAARSITLSLRGV